MIPVDCSCCGHALTCSACEKECRQALARRRSVNRGAWQGHLQRALQVVKHADAQCAARVLNACSR